MHVSHNIAGDHLHRQREKVVRDTRRRQDDVARKRSIRGLVTRLEFDEPLRFARVPRTVPRFSEVFGSRLRDQTETDKHVTAAIEKGAEAKQSDLMKYCADLLERSTK